MKKAFVLSTLLMLTLVLGGCTLLNQNNKAAKDVKIDQVEDSVGPTVTPTPVTTPKDQSVVNNRDNSMESIELDLKKLDSDVDVDL